MGMYTECILGCSLKKETPQSVIDVIQLMLKSPERDQLPKDWPFDPESRVHWMLTSGGSYYFGVHTCHPPLFIKDEITNSWMLSARFNIKNYDNEIQTFLSWLEPWIEQGSGTREFYAIVTYEEDEKPTIYYLNPKE